MELIFNTSVNLYGMNKIVRELADSTSEEPLHYDIHTEGKTLALNIRKGDYNEGIIDTYVRNGCIVKVVD